jgi:hypothetical protein
VIDVEARVRSGSSLEALLDEVRHEAIASALSLNGNDPVKAARALSITVDEVERAVEARASVGIYS